jgi:cytochrome c biogenesis protein
MSLDSHFRKTKNRGGILKLLNSLWKLFTSVRLSVVLLLSLATTSIVGTLIPQNGTPAAYLQKYGEVLFKLFATLGFFDMYHSWWFQALLVLLTANIVVCSIDRISATGKIIFTRNPSFKVSKFRHTRNRAEFDDSRSADQLKEIFEPFVSRRFRSTRIDQTGEGYAIFGEKGRWTRLGVYTVHLSVILLLIGGLIGSIFGFDGFVNIPEGEAVKNIRLRNSAKVLPLDFEIRCDDFDVSFYDTGAPKEFRSTLTILEQGRPVLKKDIIVNDPLHYKGIRMYQSSYGTLPPDHIVLNFTNKKSGKIYRQPAAVGQAVILPENQGAFVLKGFNNAAKFKDHNVGEAFIGTLTPKNGNPIEVLLPVRFPSFDKMRRGDVIITVAETKQRFYTGLQVSKDPGVWVVYSGFIMIIIGCYITFFMSHQQLCIEVIKKSAGSRIIVAGTANKNKTRMPILVKKIAAKLAKLEQPPQAHGKQSIRPKVAGMGQKA